MATAADVAASQLYSLIMEEIMVRMHGVKVLVQTPTQVHPAFVREFGFLQLRIACELVALGCLVCHNDIKAAQTKQIQKRYEPNIILGLLEELHPEFYPVPGVFQRSDGNVIIDQFPGAYLSKNELIALWNKSGEHLHKGSLRKMLRGNGTPYRAPVQIDDLMGYVQRMVNLVNMHRISRIGGEFHFVTTMNIQGWDSPVTTISVQVAIAENMESTPPPPQTSAPQSAKKRGRHS